MDEIVSESEYKSQSSLYRVEFDPLEIEEWIRRVIDASKLLIAVDMNHVNEDVKYVANNDQFGRVE